MRISRTKGGNSLSADSPRKNLRKIIPKIYLFLVFVGLAAAGAQANFLPGFVFCSSFFGQPSCDPVGNYIIAIASFPGVYLAGAVSDKWPQAPAYVFFTVLTLASLVIYLLLGILLDKIIAKERIPITLKTLSPFTKLVFAVFGVLALISLLLLVLS